MAAQRKASPSTLSSLGGISSGQRVQTPIPQSREQSTENALDAREMGTAGEGERSTVSPRSGHTGRWDASQIPPTAASREAETEPAAARDEGFDLEPTKSAGYYSLRAQKPDEVEIPRAPRVPSLDLDAVGFPPETYRPRPTRSFNSAPQTIPQPRPAFETRHPETVRTPPPDADTPAGRSRRSSYPPPPMQESPTLTPSTPSAQPSTRSSSAAPPRIYFAPHVRTQANQWAETGSLSLPGCSSPRHARALQRALLLALLHEPGWYSLPQGLRQRAGWLFCEGWESSSEGHASREIDDLATVLGLPAGAESRRLLSLAINGVVPENYSSRPPPQSSPPPFPSR